jgi:hypothetical protein
VRIQSYRFGEMVLDGKRYGRDLVVVGDRVYDSWWRKEGHRLCLEDLGPVLDDPPEVLIVGQGDPGLMQVPAEVIQALEARGIHVQAAPTAEAVHLFNSMVGKHSVAAAFHLTC